MTNSASKQDYLIFKINKPWGYEEVIYNNPEHYCMKRLFFNNEDNIEVVQKEINTYSTSFHFHVKKHETLAVVFGTLTINYLENAIMRTATLTCADKPFVIPPGLVHQLQALKGPVMLIEASTHDISTDSYKLFYHYNGEHNL